MPVWTRTDAVPGGGTLDELRVVHPVLMAHGSLLGGRLQLVGTANFEGLTLPGGELTPGAWGEGFMDRRHPHTYLHELVASLVQPLGAGSAVSLSAGKGFAPFGTDDPMSRPPLRYPVNHHLAQILERAMMIGAVRLGPLTAEAAIFNGDEPAQPDDWPNLARFGDSWSARLTARPAHGVELQGSHARVHSPEHRAGEGIDQTKWSVSARLERRVGSLPVTALVEWARTEEADGIFEYESFLAESAWRWGRHRLLYRFERTDRPEEERQVDDLFRSVRPHLENAILARTRWTLHTLGYSLDLATLPGGFRLEPFVEATTATAVSSTPVVFDPVAYFGRRRVWAGSLGVRLGWGRPMHRMGRYGAAVDAPAAMTVHVQDHDHDHDHEENGRP